MRILVIHFYTVNEYDPEKDPAEKNLAHSPAYGTTVQLLKKELIDLRNRYDDHEPASELN